MHTINRVECLKAQLDALAQGPNGCSLGLRMIPEGIIKIEEDGLPAWHSQDFLHVNGRNNSGQKSVSQGKSGVIRDVSVAHFWGFLQYGFHNAERMERANRKNGSNLLENEPEAHK